MRSPPAQFPRTTMGKDIPEPNRLWGSLSVAVYLGSWTTSLLSPFVLATLAYKRQHKAAAILAGSMAACFLPAKRLPVFAQFMSTNLARYYARGSGAVTWEDGAMVDPKNPDGEWKTMLCVHPHGIVCQGWGQMFADTRFMRFTFMFSTALYNSPFFRLTTNLIGKPAPASKECMLRYMRKGRPIALLPGGFEEATISAHGVNRIYLKHRKGFVKYSLQNGYSLTPAYVFGECDTYHNLQGLWKLRLWLNSHSIPGIAPIGFLGLPLVPDPRAHLRSVVGPPVELPKIASPTKADIDEHHGRYLTALEALFDRHKVAQGFSEDTKLEIW